MRESMTWIVLTTAGTCLIGVVTQTRCSDPRAWCAIALLVIACAILAVAWRPERGR